MFVSSIPAVADWMEYNTNFFKKWHYLIIQYTRRIERWNPRELVCFIPLKSITYILPRAGSICKEGECARNACSILSERTLEYGMYEPPSCSHSHLTNPWALVEFIVSAGNFGVTTSDIFDGRHSPEDPDTSFTQARKGALDRMTRENLTLLLGFPKSLAAISISETFWDNDVSPHTLRAATFLDLNTSIPPLFSSLKPIESPEEFLKSLLYAMSSICKEYGGVPFKKVTENLGSRIFCIVHTDCTTVACLYVSSCFIRLYCAYVCSRSHVAEKERTAISAK